MEISIPDYFSLYNEAVLLNRRKRGEQQEKYKALGEQGGAVADCLSCGACAERCPQHIDIPRRLIDVKNALE